MRKKAWGQGILLTTVRPPTRSRLLTDLSKTQIRSGTEWMSSWLLRFRIPLHTNECQIQKIKRGKNERGKKRQRINLNLTSWCSILSSAIQLWDIGCLRAEVEMTGLRFRVHMSCRDNGPTARWASSWQWHLRNCEVATMQSGHTNHTATPCQLSLKGGCSVTIQQVPLAMAARG